MRNSIFRNVSNIFLVVSLVHFLLPASLQGCFSVCSGRKKKKKSGQVRPVSSQAHKRTDGASLESLHQIRTTGGGIHEQQEDTSEMSARTASSQMYRTQSFLSQTGEVETSEAITSLSHTGSDEGRDDSDYDRPLFAQDFINALEQNNDEAVEKCMEHYELSPLEKGVEEVLICALEKGRIDIIHRIFLCNIRAGKRCYVGSNNILLPMLIRKLIESREKSEEQSEDFATLADVIELCGSENYSPIPHVSQNEGREESTGRDGKTAIDGRQALLFRALT